MIAEMSDSFWMAFFGFLGVVVVQIVIYMNNRSARAVTDKKIDDNTALTKAGTTAAALALTTAATSAQVTKQAVDSVSKKLNGGVDSALKEAIGPVKEALEAHVKQDASDIQELKSKLDEISKSMTTLVAKVGVK